MVGWKRKKWERKGHSVPANDQVQNNFMATIIIPPPPTLSLALPSLSLNAVDVTVPLGGRLEVLSCFYRWEI